MNFDSDGCSSKYAIFCYWEPELKAETTSAKGKK